MLLIATRIIVSIDDRHGEYHHHQGQEGDSQTQNRSGSACLGVCWLPTDVTSAVLRLAEREELTASGAARGLFTPQQPAARVCVSTRFIRGYVTIQ